MTDGPSAKKSRWSRGQIRFLAWVSGSAAFVAFLGVLGFAPKPATAHVTAAPPRRLPRQKIIIHTIIRRVVIVDPPSPAYVSGYSGYTPTYSSGSSYSGSSSGGVTVAAPPVAPPPPPPVSSGGSAPPP